MCQKLDVAEGTQVEHCEAANALVCGIPRNPCVDVVVAEMLLRVPLPNSAIHTFKNYGLATSPIDLGREDGERIVHSVSLLKMFVLLDVLRQLYRFEPRMRPQ
jgi:hypothetical protein